MKNVNTEIFKDELKESLKLNIDYLKDTYIQTIGSVEFSGYSSVHNLAMEALHLTPEDVDATFGYEGNPEHDSYNGYYFRKQKNVAKNSNDNVSLEKYSVSLELLLKSIFISKKELKEVFDDLSKFDAYEKIVVSSEEYKKFRVSRKMSLYNAQSWNEYIKELIRINYNEFNLDINNLKTTYRFIKEIKDGLYFGFEYDNKNLVSEIKQGKLSLPAIKIVLFTDKFNRKLRFNSDLQDSNDFFLLGGFNHPFAIALPSIEKFIASKQLIKHDNGSFEIFNPITEERKEKNIILSGDNKFSEQFKLHLFCYMHYTSFFNRSYLDFFEKSIKRIL